MNATLITFKEQLVENIRRYNASGGKLADLMPYNRAWYALRTEEGWLLGPSKFIGYENMDADAYLQRDRKKVFLDGRVTEKLLDRWSEPVEEGHPNYEELHAALDGLCARYGKMPNALARISIVQADDRTVAAPPVDDLVHLLAAVYRGLPAAQKSAFRRLALD